MTLDIAIAVLGFISGGCVFLSGFFIGRIAGRRQMRDWIEGQPK